MSGPARIAVRLTDGGLRRVRSGHPWVFEPSIRSASAPGRPGDLAVVFDDRKRFVAVGLWDPGSAIRIRVLHVGEPEPIDDAWLVGRVAAATMRRSELNADPATTAFRIVHGENDGLPGLVVDRYGSVAVVKLYSAAWLAHLDAVVGAVVAVLEPDSVVVRLARLVTAAVSAGVTAAVSAGVTAAVSAGVAVDGMVAFGAPPPDPVLFRENGLWFGADVVAGHKTGHFLDQRDNRRRIGALAAGAEALDVFACTGGFTLALAAGGARSVTSVDISAPALAGLGANMALNPDQVSKCDQRSIAGDAFAVLDDLRTRGHRFDVVVVDPPAFATRREHVSRAEAAYRRIFSAGIDLARDGGLVLLASCSRPVSSVDLDALVGAAARDRGAELDVVERTAHPADHPIGFPEGAYLNAVLARVSRRGRRRATLQP